MRIEKNTARLLEAAQRETDNFRESYTLLTGDRVVCKSKAEYDFWATLCESLKAGKVAASEYGIRPLFEALVADGREAVDSWNPQFGGSGSVDTVALREADPVGYANFARVYGQIAYSAVMETYNKPDFVFSAMIRSIPTGFSGEKIPGVSRLGDQNTTVNENGEYPRAGISQDWIDTPVTTKRGTIVEWTKEAIFFNGSYSGVQLPIIERLNQVGEELAYNKEVRIIDALVDENTTVHRYNRLGRGAVANYGDNSGSHDWDNLEASNALVDWTDINAARLLLLAMLDPNTGQPISLNLGTPTLVCTQQLDMTAYYIQTMTGFTLSNPGFATTGQPIQTQAPSPLPRFNVATSPLLATRMATDTSWFYGAPEKALAYMENWPITVVQRPANSDAEFERDVIGGVKASERGQVIVREPRYMVKCTA